MLGAYRTLALGVLRVLRECSPLDHGAQGKREFGVVIYWGRKRSQDSGFKKLEGSEAPSKKATFVVVTEDTVHHV